MTARRTVTFEEVEIIVREVIGDRWNACEPIAPDSCLGYDLELESIGFLALADALCRAYPYLDLAAAFSRLALPQLGEMTVADLLGVLRRAHPCEGAI